MYCGELSGEKEESFLLRSRTWRKHYDKVDREGLRKILRMYGVDGKFLRAVKNMYEDAKAAAGVADDLSEFFNAFFVKAFFVTAREYQTRLLFDETPSAHGSARRKHSPKSFAIPGS